MEPCGRAAPERDEGRRIVPQHKRICEDVQFKGRARPSISFDLSNVPLEISMLTQRVRSAIEARPSGWPAKTFKTVI
jgi:hypothetical protein